MYCRKCGSEIPDDSVFCLKCGTKVEVKTNDIISTDIVEEANFSSEENEAPDTFNAKTKYGILALIGIVIVLVIVILVSENAKKCELSSCDNTKQEGSQYCREHTCEEEGCTFLKYQYDSYCYTHQMEHACTVSGCDNTKVSGGEYCYEHTCAESGCYNKKGYGSDYCTEHQVDMRQKLGNNFSFRVNSAGGIELSFKAQNTSGKEIKYIRFYVDLYNAVGDKIEDEIKNTSSVYVEVTGPIANGKSANYEDIIGYNDNCAKIEIKEVTLVYMDGTSQTGHYGWYTEK